jgi:hypothetical protein
MRSKITYDEFKDDKLVQHGFRHTRLDKHFFFRFHKELKEEYNFDMFTCSECGIQEWNKKSIIMELDHLNGITTDARISNLSMKCPNCHSQTTNFRNRKVSIEERKQQLLAA